MGCGPFTKHPREEVKVPELTPQTGWKLPPPAPPPRPAWTRAMRQAGAWLIVGGVVLAVLAVAAAIIGGGAAMAPLVSVAATGPGPVPIGPGYLLLVACVGALGLGVALLTLSGPIFGGTLAPLGMMLLAFGLVADAVILGMVSQPGFEGSNVDFLIIPLILFGLMTIIGVVLTAVALLGVGGRPQLVGATFLVAVVPIALLVFGPGNGFFLPEAVLVALPVLAGGALLLGFVGLAMLALARNAEPVVADAPIGW